MPITTSYCIFETEQWKSLDSFLTVSEEHNKAKRALWKLGVFIVEICKTIALIAGFFSSVYWMENSSA